jgi:elongation factor P hydroxylase
MTFNKRATRDAARSGESGPDSARIGIECDRYGTTAAHPMGTGRLQPSELEDLFNECFESEHSTRLEGGGEEPLYIASGDLAATPHRVIYREDYFASALHEIAHWCIAGAGRRRLDDYGYWYHPDGRSGEQQQSFERAETRPQALEWIFSDLCGQAFHLSADNLHGDTGPSPHFAETVAREKRRFETQGLPPRAARFAEALRRRFSASHDFRLTGVSSTRVDPGRSG